MKKIFVLAIVAVAMLTGVSAFAADNAGRPFKGVWINLTDEAYEQLKIDLYDKVIPMPDGDGTCYGYLQMENDFVADYLIITKVMSIGKEAAKVKYYSLRYGMPADEDSVSVTLDSAGGSISFGEGQVFGPSSVCRYVEVISDNADILAAPRTGKPVAKASAGMIFPIAGMEGGCYKVTLNDGRAGYVDDRQTCAWRETDLVIPADALAKSGQYVEDDGVTLCNVSFAVSGETVYMEVSRSLVDVNKGSMKYLSTTIYKGRAEGNRLVFTAAVEGSMLTLDSPDTVKAMKAVSPYTVYYSPAHCDFVVGGKRINLK